MSTGKVVAAMPSYVVPRENGRFGARVPKRRGGMRWLGTYSSEEEARAVVAAARRPQPRRQGGRREVRPPSYDEVLALAAVGRDEAMRVFTLVAAFSGLRLFEVAALEASDVTISGRELLVREGKGGFERRSLLFEPGLSALDEFLAGIIPANNPGPIFKTERGTPYSRQHVSRLWIPMRRAVGVECTFHALRHFHACWLLDQGASVRDVSIQLGHHDNGELVRRTYGRHASEVAARARLKDLAD